MKWTAARVRALRLAHRLSQEDFAELLGASPRSVRHWESGTVSAPSLVMQRALDTVWARASEEERQRFHGSADELEGGDTRQEEVLTGLRRAVDAESSDVERRAFLQWLLGISAAMFIAAPRDLLASPSLTRAGEALQVVPIDATTHGYRQLFQTIPSDQLVPPVLEHLRLVMRRVQDAGTEGSRAKLLSSLGQVAQLAGRLSFDRDDYPAARSYHWVAIQAAQEGDDPEVTAYAVGCLASISTDCDYPREALALLRGSSCGAAASRSSQTTRAWLAALEAEAAAEAGDRSASPAALGRARSLLESATPEEAPVWVRFFDAARLTSYEGFCAMRLGLSDAEGSLTKAAASLDPIYSKLRSHVLTDLAELYLRLERLDEASETLVRSYELNTTLSRVCIRQARSVREQLERKGGPRRAKRLEEQMGALGQR